MKSEKVPGFVAGNLMEFFEFTTRTLIHPIAYFEPLTVGKADADLFQRTRTWLSPKRFWFAAISISAGTLFHSLTTTGLLVNPTILEVVIVTLVYWFVYCSLLHLFCWVLRGHGSYLDTLSVGIQLLAALFVVTSFLALIVAILIRSESAYYLLSKIPLIGSFVVKTPAFSFFAIHLILTPIYLPAALKRVHGFELVRQVIIAVFPFLAVWVVILLYMWKILITVIG